MLCTSTVIFGRQSPYLEMRRFGFGRSLGVEAGGRELHAWVAESFSARLLGLAGRSAIPAGRALLIPECNAVHTWGMRFALDIAFLEWPPNAGTGVIRLCEAVGPRRWVGVRGRSALQTAVLEAPGGTLRGLGSGAVTFKACPQGT